jgi:hypothetical protein
LDNTVKLTFFKDPPAVNQDSLRVSSGELDCRDPLELLPWGGNDDYISLPNTFVH